MNDSKSFSEKGKEKATSPAKTRDFIRARSQDKLTLNPQRDILKGGSGQEETSSQQGETSNSNLSSFRSKLDRFNENKENKSKRYNEALRIGERLYEIRKKQEESERSWQTNEAYYTNYTKGFRHHR
jgi:hypothetical protein